ncbi:MAG: cobyrinate a,c-diamide synthase [Actinomycetota bacterium]|nr:cobyrinate a,c-diamide synthase [Actinomycetota bacterium]
MVEIARVVIAAPGSGHGKTSVATGLLAAFRSRGLAVSGHKVGPDYIDPSYHALASGRPGRNLDPWLVGEDLIAPLFRHGAMTPAAADIAIVEGVMGLFDGAVGRGEFASTAHVAELIRAPVVLVIDATGVGRSVAALVHGFATFQPRVRIAGVIFNRVGSLRHEQILAEAMAHSGVAMLGTVRRQDTLVTPSRHLGLVPAAERALAAIATVDALGAAVAQGVDLDAVMRIANSAPPLNDEPCAEAMRTDAEASRRPVRVAVAGGAAFTFGYTEQVELLTRAGAQVVSFDPLHAEHLPEDVDGLVIGGGFPEAHVGQLSANASLRAQIAALVRGGTPVAAECAGLLYLAKSLDGMPMCGVLDVDAAMTDGLTLGYREAVAPSDTLLVPAGTRVRGHEFHRTACTPPASTCPAWQWKAAGDAVTEGFADGSLHASYLHLHWSGNPGIADRFVAACRTSDSRS